MRVLGTNRLKPGDILGKSIYNENSELLLAAGYKLDEEVIDLVKKHGFNYVYLIDKATEGVTPEVVISDALRHSAQVKMVDVIDTIQSNPEMKILDSENVVEHLKNNKKFGRLIKMKSIRDLVGEILDEILNNNVRIFISLPVKSRTGHEYEHAIDTALLSILLAREFDFNHKDLQLMGTAAFLHDVGKLIFVDSPDQDEDIKENFKNLLIEEHPTYSRLILEGSEQHSYTEQLIVHQHHERIDGKGYPQGLRSINKPPSFHTTNKWAQIHKHALILAVANYYDNLLSGTYDDKKYTPVDALAVMINQAGTAWNSHVVKALGNVVRRYPVGCTVVIKSTESNSYIGYTGVVSEIDINEPEKPELILTHNALGTTIDPILLDLRKEKEVHIELDI